MCALEECDSITGLVFREEMFNGAAIAWTECGGRGNRMASELLCGDWMCGFCWRLEDEKGTNTVKEIQIVVSGEGGRRNSDLDRRRRLRDSWLAPTATDTDSVSLRLIFKNILTLAKSVREYKEACDFWWD